MQRQRGSCAARVAHRLASCGIVCLSVVACSGKPERREAAGEAQTPSSGTAAQASPNSASTPLEPDDGQWVRPAKDLASTRFSQLTEINTANVRNLRVTLTISTGVNRGH